MTDKLGKNRTALLKDIKVDNLDLSNVDLDEFKNESLDRYTRLSDLEDDEKINVKHFGAKGDGVADDTQAIQDAFLEAKNSDVKRVFFPAGNYKISNTIFVSSGIWAYGMSKFSTRVFLEVDDINDLPLITPIQFSGLQEMRRWRGMFVSETADEQHEEFTEDILITDMTIDWNGQDCGKVNSISPIIFGKTKNSWVQRVKIADALPSDLADGTRMRCFSILFFISEDCGISNSHIGASDYESVSVKYISERTKVIDNIFEIDKPTNYEYQAHCIQVASEKPSAGVHLKNKYGRDNCENTYVLGNTFLLKSNVRYAATSHLSDGFWVKNNYVKSFSTINKTFGLGFKPFHDTNNFNVSSNILDLTDYPHDPLTTPVILIGTHDYGFEPVSNGIVSDNAIFCISDLDRDTVFEDSCLISGLHSNNRNIRVFGNNIYIKGKTKKSTCIVGIFGRTCQVNNNNIYFEDQAFDIDENDVSAVSVYGGSQLSISGNQVFGRIGKGVNLIDSGEVFENIRVHENQWNAIEDVTKDHPKDFEIFLDYPKEREGYTEIQLNNPIGNKYNFKNPLNDVAYSFIHDVVGGRAEILINASQKPYVINAIETNDDYFEEDTNVVLVIHKIRENNVVYWFEQYNQEEVIWVSDIFSNKAKINFENIEELPSYNIYLNGTFHQTIDQSGDEITGLSSNQTYFVQIQKQDDSLTKKVYFKTDATVLRMIWDTTKGNDPESDKITLPLVSNGNYDFRVMYQGQELKAINSYSDNKITFPDGKGEKEIDLIGTISGFGFPFSISSEKNREKLIKILNWGDNFETEERNAFINAKNLIIIPEDLKLYGFGTGENLFRGTGLTVFPALDLSGIDNFIGFLYLSANLTEIKKINVPDGINFSFFARETNLKTVADIDFSNGENFDHSFNGVGTIDQFLPRRFDNLKTGVRMFFNSKLITETWSEILINLEAHNTNNDVQIHGGSSKYNASAVSARNALIARGWTITDGGQE